MLMTYENVTTDPIGQAAEQWTRTFLERLQVDPTDSGRKRRLTGHFSFDFISSTLDGQLYPLECNARVHTAIILLPLSQIASCYLQTPIPNSESNSTIVRPLPNTAPRSWWYNDLIMRYLPLFFSTRTLALLHPSLPACAVRITTIGSSKPSEDAMVWRVDPTLVADDWVPFLILWHVFWPVLLITRWWQGKKWTRLNVSTGRIFEA